MPAVVEKPIDAHNIAWPLVSTDALSRQLSQKLGGYAAVFNKFCLYFCWSISVYVRIW